MFKVMLVQRAPDGWGQKALGSERKWANRTEKYLGGQKDETRWKKYVSITGLNDTHIYAFWLVSREFSEHWILFLKFFPKKKLV